MISKIRTLSAFLAFTFVIFYACSSAEVSGTATDTENTIAGIVQTSSGKLAKGASVQILKATDSYQNLTVLSETLTDSCGEFKVDSLLPDTVNIDVRLFDTNGQLDEIFFKENILISEINKLEIALEKPAYISGVFNYEQQIDNLTIGSNFKLRISGSGTEESIFAGDSFTIPVASTSRSIVVYPATAEVIERLQKNGFEDSLIYKEFVINDLKSADTLDLPSFNWSLSQPEKKDSLKNWKKGSVISGYVVDSLNNPVSFANVKIITDIYGLEYALGKPINSPATLSDSMGYFELPFPQEVPYDSIRLEISEKNGNNASSEFLTVTKLMENEGLNIFLDTLELQKFASIQGGVSLIINAEDSTQTNNCALNGIIIGILGTSQFKHFLTCDTFLLSNLPAGEQTLVFYSSDKDVLKSLIEHNTVTNYMHFVEVNLNAGYIQKQQGLTYSPPTLYFQD